MTVSERAKRSITTTMRIVRSVADQESYAMIVEKIRVVASIQSLNSAIGAMVMDEFNQGGVCRIRTKINKGNFNESGYENDEEN